MKPRRKRGDGGVYLRGRIWWVTYSNNGEKVSESSGSDKESDARNLLKKRMGEIVSGHFIGPDAERVTVVTSQESGEDYDLQEVPAYLAWHGITAESRAITPHPSVGDALTEAARDADLLVMGGYSHSRLREMILGGVTRHMLEKATLPLLLAH